MLAPRRQPSGWSKASPDAGKGLCHGGGFPAGHGMHPSGRRAGQHAEPFRNHGGAAASGANSASDTHTHAVDNSASEADTRPDTGTGSGQSLQGFGWLTTV